jgi:hypothetical protein
MLHDRILNWLPAWAHPRFPLVANELRKYSPIDLHVAQVHSDLGHALSILNSFLFFSTLILLIGGGSIFGFLLLVITFMLSPVLIMASELLYARVLFGIPAQTSQMIAGEIERGTWEIILSTPLPRHQIVLSKFAALFWNAQPALTPILISRFIGVGYLTLERAAVSSEVFPPRQMVNLLLLGLLIAAIPAMELLAFSSVGMLISTLTATSWNANILTWGAWASYRCLAALVFVLVYAGPSTGTLMLLLLCMAFPQWVLLLLWLLLRGDAHAFLLALGVVYILLPLVIALGSLILNMRLIQRQWI